MKPSHAFVLGLVILVSTLGGCSKGPVGHGMPQPPRVATCEPGVPGGKLLLTAAGGVHTFNPLAGLDAGSDSIVRLLFNSLVTINYQSQEAEPGLAESWSVAADQKTWTFKLRKNLRWSDGEPLTADDVVFTWNEIINNSKKYNQVAYDLFHPDGKTFEVTKVDGLTVRVVTPDVFAPFLEYFGSVVVILPRHTLGRWAATADFLKAYAITDKPENIVGSGPFRVKSIQSSSVILERNPEYCAVDKKGQRLPYLDEVELVVPADVAAIQKIFLLGASAVCESIPLEDMPAFQQAATNGNFKIVDLGIGAQRDFMWFNQNTGAGPNGKPFVEPYKLRWFRDKRFRQAISCGINRDQIVRDVYNGHAQVVYGFLSSDNKKWNDPSVRQYAYDPAKARALLAELGMTRRPSDDVLVDPVGHPVEFTLMASYGNPVRAGIAKRVQEDLKQLGIQMSYAPVGFPVLVKHINETMDYDCASMGFGGGGMDPASQMNVLKSEAPLHQWFPTQRQPSTDWEKRIDALMDHQMQTLDFSQRKKDFDEVQAIWAEEMPMICIAAPTASAAVRSNIGNIRPAVASTYHATWNIEELYIKK